MRAVQYCPLLLFSLVLLATNSKALRCYTCMGSNNADCNRQGSKSCPSYSDACAVVVGHDSESNSDSGVMKSCSYKSFCSQANSQGYRAPGVRVYCCYGDDCNVTSFASLLPGPNYLLLFLPLFFHCFFK
ncbi:lymphocyte antigen 6 family member pge isoform X1 [Sander lucioperca]|uniref:lymphocyte antigen 6 family member pge isoform X1 n=1 Tax=Sander lucioperca TaxID=283035 RepID=UPI00125E375C|nr:lymphocyte antigen 6 family member pge isoform X1 [Sander lucioperca]